MLDSLSQKFAMHVHRRGQLASVARAAFLVFATSIVITLLFWMALPDPFQTNENTDYISFYEPVARSLIAGDGLTYRDGTLALRYPPGYPLLLAAIFQTSQLLNISEETVLSTFTLLSMGLASVFVFILARSVWSPWPAFAVSLVWMTYPFALWLTKQPNSEMPFSAVFYVGFGLFWYGLLGRSHAWLLYFLAGLLVGFAMLIRPIAIGMGFLLGAILCIVGHHLSMRRRLALASVILLGNLVAIVPWEAWVYASTGQIIPLSTGGRLGIRNGLTYAHAPTAQGHRQIIDVPQNVASLMHEILTNEIKSLQALGSLLAEKLRSEPLTIVTLYSLKTVRSWYGTNSGRFETASMLLQAVYLMLILWSSRAAWRLQGRARDLTLSVWLVTAYFWGMTILVLSILRYMVPAMGLLFVLLPAAFLRGQTTSDNID